MPCGRLATQGASPQALAFAKVMGQGEGSLLAVHWLFDSGSSEAAMARASLFGRQVRTYPFHYLPAKLLQNGAASA